MVRVRAASDRHWETCVGNKPFQELLPSARPQPSLGAARNGTWRGIAANQLAEKRIFAQRHRLRIQQLLERAFHGLTLRDFLVDAVVGELLLDAGWQVHGNWRGATVLQSSVKCHTRGRSVPFDFSHWSDALALSFRRLARNLLTFVRLRISQSRLGRTKRYSPRFVSIEYLQSAA